MKLEATALAYGPPSAGLPEGLEFTLGPGELLHLQGENGTGKSLLARTLLGLSPRRAGEVKLEYRQASYLPQTHRHLTHLPFSLKETLGGRAVPELTKGMPLDRAWNLASGGERQRVMLSRFFFCPGDFLVLDEPFNHLDTSAREDVRRLLREAFLQRPETAAVLISHDDSPAAWLPRVRVKSLELRRS